MNVFFRSDASVEIGNGHIMRCLTLAHALHAYGARIFFICRGDMPADLLHLMEDKKYQIYLIPKEERNTMEEENNQWPQKGSFLDLQFDARETITSLKNSGETVDWLVVDHYELDNLWEGRVRPYVQKIFVIDDLANRVHDCDVILDQAIGENGIRYKNLVPKNCKGLFGSRFIMLRRQFTRREQPIRTYSTNTGFVVHVFFGSSDRWGHSIHFSRLLLSRFNDLNLYIALGKDFLFPDELEELKRDFGDRVKWQIGVDDMAETMLNCNFAIGSPGMAAWERAYLGLPSAYISTSDNQKNILEILEKIGFCVYLGHADEISDEEFESKIRAILNNKEKLLAMSIKGMKSIDGLGTERVVAALMEE